MRASISTKAKLTWYKFLGHLRIDYQWHILLDHLVDDFHVSCIYHCCILRKKPYFFLPPDKSVGNKIRHDEKYYMSKAVKCGKDVTEPPAPLTQLSCQLVPGRLDQTGSLRMNSVDSVREWKSWKKFLKEVSE